MKTTPQVPTSANAATANQNAKGSTGKLTITPGEPVALSELLKQAKGEDNASQPAATPDEPKPYPVAEQPATDAPAPVQVAPKPEPQQSAAPVRSRSEEIEYQIAKAKQMQLINGQLQSLKDKLAELNQFSYGVDKDDDHRYGRVAIFDDNNREFICRNHGVAALIVEHLKGVFGQKVEEKESELLTVSRS